MPIAPGDELPSGTFQTVAARGVETLSVEDVFAGKKVVLFAVPGAFTPTCSDSHFPGFLLHSDELRRRGVDTIACLAVNDAFVMDAWRRARNAGEEILMLADGNGDYARLLGLELDATRFGMGIRIKRFAAVVTDRIVEHLYVEPGGGVRVSSAEAVLAALDRA